MTGVQTCALPISSKTYLKKYVEYIDSTGKLAELTTRLHKEDGLSKTDSSMIARQIINNNKWCVNNGNSNKTN